CARLADALLRACPRLVVLATSREALGIAGETTWRVPSLATPEPWPTRQPLPAAAVARYAAVRLFVDRATAVRPGFRPGGGDAPSGGAGLRPAGGDPPGPRARGGAGARAAPGAAPHPPGGPFPAPDGREPHRPGAAPDPAGGGGLELPPPDRAG